MIGLPAIEADWAANRDGHDEVFAMAAGILAVDGATGVARVFVRYAVPEQEYLNLWIARFARDGRCRWFEEWPFWPGKPWLAAQDQGAGWAAGGPGAGPVGEDERRA